MEKFNNFAENLMRVVLVPDDTSDSIAPVSHDLEPKDMFSKEVSSYMGDEEHSDSGCGCSECGGDSSLEEPHQETEEVKDIQITHDTNGLRVQFNGIEVLLPNEVVEEIKEVLGDYSESDENESEEHEEMETPEHEQMEQEEGEEEAEEESEEEEEEEG